MKKYNVEKVLYYANTECGFNFSVDEAKSVNKGHFRTDLQEIVSGLLRGELIVEVARDDADIYYRATKNGEICLLEMQIRWRKSRGKSTDEHEQRLVDLRSN